MELHPAAVATGARQIAYDTVGSTNAEALALARAGEVGPLWVTAVRQTTGRGRRGRSWVSEPGNLYTSLLLTDPSAPQRTAELPLVAVLALRDAVLALSPALAPRVAVKWPNDLLLDGKKVAGILVEGEKAAGRMHVVVGLGVNCGQHPQDTAHPATSLAAAGADPLPERLFSALSAAMQVRLVQWDRGQGFAAIRSDWLSCVAGLGADIRVRLETRELVGCFEAIDDAGRLILRLSDGQRELVSAGDVFPIAARAAPSC